MEAARAAAKAKPGLKERNLTSHTLCSLTVGHCAGDSFTARILALKYRSLPSTGYMCRVRLACAGISPCEHVLHGRFFESSKAWPGLS